MKILMLSREYPPMVGGVGAFACAIERGLSEIGCDVEVATNCSRGVLNPRRGARAIIVKTGQILQLLARCHRLVRSRPDWIVAMTCTHEGVIALAYAKATGIRYAVMLHGSELIRHERSPLTRGLVRAVLANADVLLANSMFTVDAVRAFMCDQRQVQLLNPPVPDEPRQAGTEMARPCQSPYLFTSSRLVPRKGHLRVIRALAGLAQDYPDLNYVFTGDGPYLSTVLNEASQLGVRSRVQPVGVVSRERLQQLYAGCTIYVSPGTQESDDVEGFGIAFCEAGLHEKPVIAGGSGGACEAVLHGRTGLVLGNDAQEHLELAVRSLLDDEGLRHAFGRAGRDHVLQTFGVIAQARKLRDMLADAAR